MAGRRGGARKTMTNKGMARIIWTLGALSVLGAPSCAGKQEIIREESRGTGGAGAKPTIDGGETGGSGGNIFITPDGGSTGGTTGDGGGFTECGTTSCGVGQRCTEGEGGVACVDVACRELTCSALEECAPAPGGGSYCKSVACGSDVECPTTRYCDGRK